MAHEHHTGSVPPPPAPPPPAGPRKLVRRPDRGHIAGVCQGVAEYFNVDPLIVRIAAVVLLVTGPGFFAYLAAWIFVPAEDGSMLVDSVKPIPEDKTTQVVGVGLIVLAASLVFGGWWSPAREWLWPLGLVAAGAWLLLRRGDDDDRPVPPAGPAPTTPPAPWAAPDPVEVVSAPPAPADPTSTDPTSAEEPSVDDPAADGTSVGPVEAAPPGGPPTSGADPTAFAPGPAPDAAPTQVGRRRRRFLGPLVFGALLLWSGIAWMAGVEVRNGLAVGLCIIGAGFVVGAFVGGSRVLVLPALLVGAALVVTSAVDIPWGGGIGDKEWHVDQMSELDRRYELAIGEATLDLGDLRVPASRDERVEVALGIGDLTVIVPRGTDLDISAGVGAGEANVLGRKDDGLGVDVDRRIAGSSTRGSLQLDLHVGLGQLRVEYAGG